MTYVNIFFTFRSHLTVQTNRAVPCLITMYAENGPVIIISLCLNRYLRLMNKTAERPVPYCLSDAPAPSW